MEVTQHRYRYPQCCINQKQVCNNKIPSPLNFEVKSGTSILTNDGSQRLFDETKLVELIKDHRPLFRPK
jgi:hypothetical protein